MTWYAKFYMKLRSFIGPIILYPCMSTAYKLEMHKIMIQKWPEIRKNSFNFIAKQILRKSNRSLLVLCTVLFTTWTKIASMLIRNKKQRQKVLVRCRLIYPLYFLIFLLHITLSVINIQVRKPCLENWLKTSCKKGHICHQYFSAIIWIGSRQYLYGDGGSDVRFPTKILRLSYLFRLRRKLWYIHTAKGLQ